MQFLLYSGVMRSVNLQRSLNCDVPQPSRTLAFNMHATKLDQMKVPTLRCDSDLSPLRRGHIKLPTHYFNECIYLVRFWECKRRKASQERKSQSSSPSLEAKFANTPYIISYNSPMLLVYAIRQNTLFQYACLIFGDCYV